jgi:hypothetical protein
MNTLNAASDLDYDHPLQPDLYELVFNWSAELKSAVLYFDVVTVSQKTFFLVALKPGTSAKKYPKDLNGVEIRYINSHCLFTDQGYYYPESGSVSNSVDTIIDSVGGLRSRFSTMNTKKGQQRYIENMREATKEGFAANEEARAGSWQAAQEERIY